MNLRPRPHLHWDLHLHLQRIHSTLLFTCSRDAAPGMKGTRGSEKQCMCLGGSSGSGHSLVLGVLMFSSSHFRFRCLH